MVMSMVESDPFFRGLKTLVNELTVQVERLSTRVDELEQSTRRPDQKDLHETLALALQMLERNHETALKDRELMVKMAELVRAKL